jgi:hypothetical protein
MTEEEFDSFMQGRSFGTEDARRAEAQMSRDMALLATLGTALWGKTVGDVRSQMLKPYPAIPSGFDLTDFRELLRAAVLVTREIASLFHMLPAAQSTLVAAQGITVWEARYEVWVARCEIARRAIEYLEKH